MKVFEALKEGILIADEFIPILKQNEDYKKLSENDKETLVFLYFVCISCGYSPKTSVGILQKSTNILGQINADIQIKAAQHGMKSGDLEKIAKAMAKAKSDGFDIVDFIRKMRRENGTDAKT